MKFLFRQTVVTCVMVLVTITMACAAEKSNAAIDVSEQASQALDAGMNTLGVSAASSDFMILTNAGYGQVHGASTERYLDVIMQKTGRTPGTRTLLAVNTPCSEPLWFSLYNAASHDLVFIKWKEDGFAVQTLNIAPEQILTPAIWSEAAKGLLGKRTFSVVSIILSWQEGASWTMLKGAELHDHFCPGLNAGFIAKAYLDKNLPLGPGDSYVFVGAPPICAMDALQSAYGRTMGKKGAFSMLVPEAAAKLTTDGVTPTIIAMRVNNKKDVCDGVVIGFDWSKSEQATGVSEADRNPKGGHANPLFYISRVKMSWKLAQMSMEEKLACIKDMGRFSGKASLEKKVEGAGADPYAAIPQ